ncbi:MAG: sulfate adenylyltransferase subunit 2 [Candidatus Deianiraeaceae bacterium]|jgi:sulfate adenylyltransferase subunit 2
MNKYLNYLEEESIYIIREAVAEFNNPVFLYSIGKDSSVLLHLILKAFYPAKPPLPLLHIDTGWKFKEMIKFRDETIKKHGLNLIIHQNQEGLKQGINPIDHPNYTDIMKTAALRQALEKYKFDVAFGGARRDEEKSRAKERIFSFRNGFHKWDAKNQRPELFNNFNTKVYAGESMRVFPLSNWTEIDVWEYIKAQEIDIVPLYFAKKRPVVEREGSVIMVDDSRLPLTQKPQDAMVRFRTLGCYPLTGAVPSEADTLDKIVSELKSSRYSERQGRLIDSDQVGSMERKKQEGYF